jgi:hypothetical protein
MPNVYRDEAFQFVAENLAAIEFAASKTGLSAGVIAGAMAEENHDYVDKSARNSALDLWASIRLFSNEEIVNCYKQAVEEGIADRIPEHVSAIGEKFTNPVLADVGRSNFKIAVAIKLLQNYFGQNSAADPLDLGVYKDNYRQLVEDLIFDRNGAPAKFWALILKEAEAWYQSNVDSAYWDSLSSLEKDGLLITYANFGRTEMERKRIAQIAAGLPYAQN